MATKKKMAFPSRIATGAAAYVNRDHAATAGSDGDWMHSVFLQIARIESGKGSRIREVYTTDAAACWQWLADRIRPDGQTWLVVYRLGDFLRASSFFDAVDAGTFSLRPQSGLSSTPETRKAGRPSEGPMVILSDPPTIIKAWSTTGGKLLMCDLRNWMDSSMDEIASSMRKRRVQRPNNLGHTSAVRAALKDDASLTLGAMIGYIDWLKARHVPRLMPTVGGQSFALYSTRYRKRRPAHDDEPVVRELERRALMGGKVEVRYVGQWPNGNGPAASGMGQHNGTGGDGTAGSLYHLDVTGLYPSLMRGGLFPVALSEWCLDGKAPAIDGPTGALDLIGDVLIRSERETYPLKDGRGLVHARGEFQTTLAGPQLRLAVVRGHVKKWFSYARYILDRPFGDFVSDLWRARLRSKRQGNKVYDRAVKLLLNSLWGKFAARTPEWVNCENPGYTYRWGVGSHVDASTGEIVKTRMIAGVCQRMQKRTEHPDAYPAIAAYVTSYGRERMDALAQIAGHNRVYYIAVDALIVDEVGFYRLCDAGSVADNVLGKLRVKEVVKVADFRGVNRYWTNGTPHVAGLKLDSIELSEGKYIQTNTGTLAPALLSNSRSGLPLRPHCVDVSRRIVYGEVLPSGRVLPPVIARTPF